jgi:arylsulfatase A-like enzyme
MGSERTVPDDETTRRAIAWIASQGGPFGLYLNFQSTHFPYVVPRDYKKPFQPDKPTRGKFHYLSYPKSDRAKVVNRYDNALAFVDQQIGVLVSALRDQQVLDNTIIVITADHGEMFGDHEMVTHGRSLFDAEARVPLLIRYPQRVRAGEDQRPVSTLDILPTLSSLLQIPVHPGFQGADLLGESYDSARPVFLNIQGMRSREGVVCEGYKYTRGPSGSKPALYNLEKDPHESTNLVDEEPRRAELLDRFLAAHMRAQMAYYRPTDDSLRSVRFAPRFGRCPTLDRILPEATEMLEAMEADAQNGSPASMLIRASHLN